MARPITVTPTTLRRLCTYQSTLATLDDATGSTTSVGTLHHSEMIPAEKYRELVPQSDHIADMHECYAINTGTTPATHQRIESTGGTFRIRHVGRFPANVAVADVLFWRLFLEPVQRLQ